MPARRGQLPRLLRRRRARPIVTLISRTFTRREIRRFRSGRTTIGSRVAGGVPVLLLHPVGRRSGEARTTPLLFHREADGSLLLVAANGGADWDPHWLHNLRATPEVEVEVGLPGDPAGARHPMCAVVLDDAARDAGATRYPMHAIELDAARRDAAWEAACSAIPTVAAAQRTTRRPIPLVRLVRR